MKEFDRKLCLNNIYFLAKKGNIKIGELESSANVSVGYFSRLKNDDNSSNFNVDTLFLVAQKLGVTIDDLVSSDLAKLTDNEAYIYSFINKLCDKTKNNKIEWMCETKSTLLDISNYFKNCNNKNKNNYNPLIKLLGDDFDNQYLSYFSEYIGDTCLLSDSIFSFNSKGGRFYLSYCSDNDLYSFYELYYFKNNSLIKVCNSLLNDNSETFEEALSKLFKATKSYCAMPNINNDLKDAIESILDESEIDDDSLPF